MIGQLITRPARNLACRTSLTIQATMLTGRSNTAITIFIVPAATGNPTPTYVASVLPAGISFNTSTRVISRNANKFRFRHNYNHRDKLAGFGYLDSGLRHWLNMATSYSLLLIDLTVSLFSGNSWLGELSSDSRPGFRCQFNRGLNPIFRINRFGLLQEQSRSSTYRFNSSHPIRR